MSHHDSGPHVTFPRGDARLDFTDLYAFPKPGDGAQSIFIVTVRPSLRIDPPGPTSLGPSHKAVCDPDGYLIEVGQSKPDFTYG